MKMRLSALLTVCCLSLSSLAFAAHPLATDDTGTAGMLKFQVETSAEFGWDKETEHGTRTTSNYQTLNVAVTAGVLDSLDLVVSYPFTWQRIEENSAATLDNAGLNDLAIALKWRILELGPASLAIKPAITIPTGNHNRGLGSGRAAYGATLISTVEFKPVTLHANMGYTNQRYTDADRFTSREHLWNFSLAGTLELLKGLQLVAEVGTTTNPNRADSTWPAFMTGGMIYSVLENLDLDLGIKGGLTSPETDIALLTGVTFRFP